MTKKTPIYEWGGILFFVLMPIGAKVVTKKQAFASAVANEIEKREALKNKT